MMRAAALVLALLSCAPCLAASSAVRSRSFSTTSDYLSSSDAGVTGQITRLACWIRPDNVTNDMVIAWAGDSSQNDKHFHRLIAAGAQTGDPIRCSVKDNAGGSTSDTSGSFVAGSWQHASHYVDLSTASNNFVALDGSFDGGSTPADTPSGVNLFSIGSAQDSTPDSAFSGEIGECISLSAVSYATDSDAERRKVVRELSRGLMIEYVGPRRSTSSTNRGVGFPYSGGGVASDAWAITGSASPEPSWHETARSLTVGGTSTTAGAGPPVFLPVAGQ